MTQHDILMMARKSGGLDITSFGWTSWVGTQTTDFLERFAERVAAAKLRRLYAVNEELLKALKDAHEHIFVASPAGDKESDRVLQVIETVVAKAEGKI